MVDRLGAKRFCGIGLFSFCMIVLLLSSCATLNKEEFLTVAFEFLFGHYGAKHSWTRLIQDYNLPSGRLWAHVLAAVAAAPYVVSSSSIAQRQPGFMRRTVFRS